MTEQADSWSNTDRLSHLLELRERALLDSSARYKEMVRDLIAERDLARQLAERGKEAARLEDELARLRERESKILEQREALKADLAREKEMRRSMLEARDAARAKRDAAKAQLQEAKEDKAKLQRTLQEVRQSLEARDAEVSDLQNSRSWKVTAPLRWVNRVRRMGRKTS
jgi:O-antigen chain-terminating methyltransferase